MYDINNYTKFTTILYYLASPFIKCNKYLKNINDSKITITSVFFINQSPLRKETIFKQAVNIKHINHSWKELKPKIGDFLEVHYSVPYKKLDQVFHKSFIVSYIYPSNIHFPPYDLKYIQNYEKNSCYKEGVLIAYYKNQDITANIIPYSGPFGNFYSDLPPRYGIKITGNTLLHSLGMLENIDDTDDTDDTEDTEDTDDTEDTEDTDDTEDSIFELVITNNNGQDFKFNHNNNIRI
jgi:hypothetical protein